MAAIENAAMRFVQENTMKELAIHFRQHPDQQERLSTILNDLLHTDPKWIGSHPSFAIKMVTFISQPMRLIIMPRLIEVLKRSGVLRLSEPTIRHNVISALQMAGELGDEEAILAMLDGGMDPHLADANGNTALHAAAAHGHTKLALKLIQYGLDPKLKNSEDASVLICACEGGCIELALTLIDNGMNPNEQDVDRLTPLHLACGTGNVDLALALLSRDVNLDLQDKKQRTPLHIACQELQEDVAVMMLQKGANHRIFDNWGRTALHYACREGFLHAAKWMIDDEANIDMQDISGWTPLRHACAGERYALVEMLFEEGANGFIGDNYDDTCLHYAIESGKERLAALILEHGRLEIVFSENADDERPIDLAMAPQYRWAMDLIENKASEKMLDLAEILSSYAERGHSFLMERFYHWFRCVENKKEFVSACSEFAMLMQTLANGCEELFSCPEFAFDRLTAMEKMTVLPAYSPEQIKAAVESLSDEEKEKLKSTTFIFVDIEAMPVVEMIRYLISQAGIQIGGHRNLLLRNFKRIPPKYMAIVAHDPALLGVMNLLSASQKSVIVPQWNKDKFFQFIKELPIAEKLEYMQIATAEQKLVFAELAADLKPARNVTVWCEAVYPRIKRSALRLRERFDGNRLSHLQREFVRLSGLARQYLSRWEVQILRLKEMISVLETDDEAKTIILDEVEKYLELCRKTRDEMRVLRKLLFEELEVQDVVPEELLDPIQCTKMEKPLICPDGYIFDESTLVRLDWRNPYTNQKVDRSAALLLTDDEVLQIKRQDFDAIALEGVTTSEELRQRLIDLEILSGVR